MDIIWSMGAQCPYPMVEPFANVMRLDGDSLCKNPFEYSFFETL